jgi:hypothetical protein
MEKYADNATYVMRENAHILRHCVKKIRVNYCTFEKQIIENRKKNLFQDRCWIIHKI